MLTADEARDVYNKVGAKQDSQAYYEDVATQELIQHGDFFEAECVAEFGCGTGRFAEKLLEDTLSLDTVYWCFDSSPTMIDLTRTRLSRYGSRVHIGLTDGSPHIPLQDQSCDRFVSNFVFDLLSEKDINRLLEEARRVLKPGGLLCITGLTKGFTFESKVRMGFWSLLHFIRPHIVGGCRPLEMGRYLKEPSWKIRHAKKFVSNAIPSEALIAQRV